MNKTLPTWAVRTAVPTDRLAAKQAYEQNTMQTNWDACNSLKAWAKQQGWPTPWLSFQTAFFQKMLADDESFALALTKSGLTITIPKQTYTFSDEKLSAFDRAYEEREWRGLVESLREVRRAVEAGVVVHVDGKQLTSFDSFYSWAHGRYHALEDGYDSWIGDDKS
jgi:hypothetical protein